MLKESSRVKDNTNIYYEVAKIRDVHLLQGTLKEVYGKSPWNYAVFWIELINRKNNLYLKMFNENTYVGFIGLRFSDIEAHITSIAILPNHQKQGLGKILLKRAIDCSRDRNCLKLSLEVKKSNARAITMYKRTGFSKVGIKEKYYKENQEDAIDMVFVLSDK